jgi:hypothetical protein
MIESHSPDAIKNALYKSRKALNYVLFQLAYSNFKELDVEVIAILEKVRELSDKLRQLEKEQRKQAPPKDKIPA